MSNLKNFNLVIQNQRTQDYLADVLHDKKNTFVSNLTALVSNDEKLQQCEPLTVMYAALTATALDLPLDKSLGFCYVIPYNNRKAGKVEAQYQIGYKGLVQLAIRTGQFSRINVTDVREGELKRMDRLTGDIEFDWLDDAQRAKKEVIGYVAFFSLVNGFSKTLYMSVDELRTHAKRYSQTYSSRNDYVRQNSKWETDFDSMCRKTLIKRILSKYAPLSVEMQTAIVADQSVQREAGEYSYVDNDKTAAKSALTDMAAEAAVEEVEAEELFGGKPDEQPSEEKKDEPQNNGKEAKQDEIVFTQPD